MSAEKQPRGCYISPRDAHESRSVAARYNEADPEGKDGAAVQWLHERQPVILTTQAEIDTWLDTSSNAWSRDLTMLEKPYADTKPPLEW